MHILHLNQRNPILFRYLRDKKKKGKKGAQKKKGGGGVKIHPFHLPWIRASDRVAEIMSFIASEDSNVMSAGQKGSEYLLADDSKSATRSECSSVVA